MSGAGTADDPWVLKTPPGTSEYQMYENKPANDGTLEAWARASDNPIGGWYGLRKGYRGRFAMYVPPLLEHLGLVELEHNPRNNRVRA